MKVFVTGGTGYVGTVLVERLANAGHAVTGLARSVSGAEALTAAGATPLHGSLIDVELLSAAAVDADAVVHAAVDVSMTAQAQATELDAVAALVQGAGSSATGKPVVYTSTALVYGFDPAQSTSEDADLPELSAQPVKAAAERVVLAAPGVTGIVLRPALVFGRGGSGLVVGLIRAASAAGVATYVDAGDNAWSSVHVDDLAALYLAALERPAAGVYNAAGPQPFTFRALAEAIATLTRTEASSLPLADATQQMGPLAHVLATTSRLSADRARATFGWTPAGPDFLDDVRTGSYRSLATATSRS